MDNNNNLSDGSFITFNEILLNDSRITPKGNGNSNARPICIQPTTIHKWWASIFLGLIFAILNSPPAYYLSNKLVDNINKMIFPQYLLIDNIKYKNIIILILHTIVFILIIRIILW